MPVALPPIPPPPGIRADRNGASGGWGPALPRGSLRSTATGQSRGCVAPQTFSLDLDPNLDGPRLARLFLRRILSGCGQQRHVSAAGLLVSELVTNAVVHARSPVHVKVAVLDTAFRVEVNDSSSSPPRRLRSLPSKTAGRGLILVDALADDGTGRLLIGFHDYMAPWSRVGC